MIFTESQPKYSILDLGFDSTLTKTLLSFQGDTPEVSNVFTSGVAPRTLIAGELIIALEQQAGVVFSGKTGFNNNESGYRLGIDTDGLGKFYIGTSSDYFNFNGTNIIISGTLSAGAIDIGGSDATSWHVDTNGNMWWGSAGSYAAATIKISSAGSVDFTTGTFSGTVNAATIIGSTFTGGTFQTAASGIRIVIASATNSLIMYDASANDILDFGSEATVIMRILPFSDVTGLIIQNTSTLVEIHNLLEATMQNASSTGVAIAAQNSGAGAVITATATATGKGIVITKSGTAAEALEITQNTAEDGIEINQIGNGACIDINKTGTGAGYVIDIANAGTGYSIYINQSNSSNANSAIFLTNAGSVRTLDLAQTATDNTNALAYFATSGLGNVLTLQAISNASRVNAVLNITSVSGQGAHLHLNPIVNAPGTPSEGDIYADTDTHLYYYNGTVWKQLDN